MFRRPQILTWSCPLRSLLLLRESHLSAFTEHAGAGWQGARLVKERRYEGISGKGRSNDGSSLSTETACCSNLDSERHHHPQGCTSSKTKPVSDPVSSYWDCFTNSACPQQSRRPEDSCQPSLSRTNKIQCNLLQNHLQHRQHSVTPLSLSTHTPLILSYFHIRPRSPSIVLHQTRAVHQAAPRLAETWRDCLSVENEDRCRRSLGPNLKLYEVGVGRKEASQRQGKSQGRCASVLVSLCSVKGEPAFLFTLRSSTLKGRHKGDVSFAGGKSDPADRDVVATALREAREELGVAVPTERVWGVLKPLRDMSGMMIAPVLANLGPLEELTFKPNPGEVEEIFTLSLSHLCNPQNCGYTHFRTGDKYGYTLPVFRNGKHRVWGLTAVALTHTLKLIVPP